MTALHRRDWGTSAALFVSLILFLGLRNRYTFGPPELTYWLGGILAVVVLPSVYSTLTGKQRRPVMATGALISLVAIAIAFARAINTLPQ